ENHDRRAAAWTQCVHHGARPGLNAAPERRQDLQRCVRHQPHDIAFAGYAVARERRLAEKAAADLLRAEPQRRGAIAPARRKIPPSKVVAIKRLRGVATRTVGAAIVAEQYLIARR